MTPFHSWKPTSHCNQKLETSIFLIHQKFEIKLILMLTIATLKLFRFEKGFSVVIYYFDWIINTRNSSFRNRSEILEKIDVRNGMG